MHTAFRPRQVYLAASWMAPVGRYNGKDKEHLSFLEMAERCGEVFSGGPVRRETSRRSWSAARIRLLFRA